MIIFIYRASYIKKNYVGKILRNLCFSLSMEKEKKTKEDRNKIAII